MTAMRPAPKHARSLQVSEVEEKATVIDNVIDGVIQQIDASLLLIHQKCERGSIKPPTDRLPRAALAVFQDMQEDPLLNEAGTDICLCTKKQKTSGSCGCRDHHE